MNFEQLLAVLSVVENGSFRSAAEKLNRSQPALSATIKQLEEEFDILIFDRSEYRPRLTEVGSAFVAVAKNTVESAKYTERVAIELGKMKAETKLLISVDPLISTEVIEIIALECARPVLPVHLIIEKSILKQGYPDLLSGEVDLALASRPDTDEPFEAIHLENVTLSGVVSRRLLHEQKTANEYFLTKHPQIVVYDKRFDQMPTESGAKIFVPDHHTKLKLIEGGIGWGRVAESESAMNQALIKIESKICKPIHLELCLVRPKFRPIGPIARAIWAVFEKRAQNTTVSRKPL